ncbi:MAG: NAD-dependent succinate-semialdehyde dehydrogenase [Bacteroidota bacterium]
MLKHPELLQLLNETEVNTETFAVHNPATNEVLALVEDQKVPAVQLRIDQANEAYTSWKKSTVDERGQLLKAWADLIRTHLDDLSLIMTLEQGKPLAESSGEILYSAGFLDWYAAEAQNASGRMMPAHRSEQRLLVSYQALGVGAIITPWNFPALMILREAAPALAAGCTVVVKPADLTPLTAIAIETLARKSGIPPGVFTVITCSKETTPSIGDLLTSSPKIHKMSFTGSTPVGKLLAKAGTNTLTRMSLELGGNAPFIIFDDADLDTALEGLLAAKFRNAGQACVAANRIFIQASIYNTFIPKLVAKMEALNVGNGREEGTNMGPLISLAAIEKAERLVADALAKGGQLLLGGKRHAKGAQFFEPTLIVNTTEQIEAYSCEIFAPIAMIYTFDDEAEVLEKANDTIHGLAAYFYTQDRSRCWRMSEGLDAGIVCENTVAFSSARTPFGGFKQSGVGRDGGVEGLREWQEVKYRCIGGL